MPDVVAAPAKLTLSLRVLGRRDDGYHLLDAEMVSLELADRLIFDAGDALEVDGPKAAGVPTDDTNLVRRALRAVGRRAHVRLTKHIPTAGGLGGGSTDAAAVLRWAGCANPAVAVALGADVPFCLVGGRARVTGVGEHVDPLPPVARAFTLVMPPLAVSTGAAFAAWDALDGPRADGRNDLEPAALVVEPRLAWWRDRIAEAAGTRPTLAGSGATWFVEGERPDLVEALSDATVTVTRTAERG